MVTIGDAMVTLLTDNWAGAGAPPTFGHLVDQPDDLAETTEQVIVRLPIFDDAIPINDILSNFKYVIQIRVKSTVSDDRLKVLADETIRIINTYAITGITRQFAKRGEDTSDRKRQIFSRDIWTSLEEHASTAGTSYSSPGAGDVVFPADVTVTDDLITDNIVSADPISIRPSGNIVDYLEFDTVGGHPVITTVGGGTLQIRGDSGPIRLQPSGDYTDSIEFSTTANVPKIAAIGASDLELGTDTNTVGVDQIAALLMFGSANAAWVPCMFRGGLNYLETGMTAGYVTDDAVAHMRLCFDFPKPTTKGGLKLYVAGTRIGLGDADANDYVDNTYVFGMDGTSQTQLDRDTTDKNSAQVWEDTFTAVDVSGYEMVSIVLTCSNNDASALDVYSALLKCYYAA